MSLPYKVQSAVKHFKKNVDFLRSRPTLQQLGYTPNINYNYDVYSPDTFAAYLKDDYNKRAQLQKQIDSSVVTHNRNIPVEDNEVTRALPESGSSVTGSGSTDSTRVDPGTAAVIGAGINFIGQNLTNSANAAAVSEANEKSIDLQRNSQNYNTAMVQYQNEYNTNLNQYLRGLDAGVSPYMAAGAIQGYSGGIASSPSVPNIQAARYQNPAEPLMYGLNSFAQLQLREKELEIADKNADSTRMSVETDQSYKQKLESNLEKINEQIDHQNEQIDALRDLILQQKETEVQTTRYKSMENDVYEKFGEKSAEAMFNKVDSEFKLNQAQKDYVRNMIYFNSKKLQFELLASMRDFSRVINDTITVFNNTKLANSLSRMQNSITSLNNFDLKSMKPLELQLLQNTLKYDDTNKLFDVINNGIGTFNNSMDFISDPLGARRHGIEVLHGLGSNVK